MASSSQGFGLDQDAVGNVLRKEIGEPPDDRGGGAGDERRKMATGPITKTSVDALKCDGTKDREILWDGGHR